ncbi:MAG: hypothetical protein AB2652_09050 [Candidatus Thiodiazotropha endolucinida]
MPRKIIKGTSWSRYQTACFLRSTKIILKDYFSACFITYDIALINRITKKAAKYRVNALSKSLSEYMHEGSTLYAKYKKNLQRKYGQYHAALFVNDTIPIPLNDDFVRELKKAGVSVDTANIVLDAYEKAIYSKDLIFPRANSRPKKKDYYFNVPLGHLLAQSGLNRAESSRLIAEIRIATGTLVSEKEEIDKLSKRIEQQLRNEEIKN